MSHARSLRIAAAVVLAAATIIVPAVAFAAGQPQLGPATVFTEGFEGASAPSRLTVDFVPTFDDLTGKPAAPSAYWGRVTARAASGTHGLWCAGGVPSLSWTTSSAVTAGAWVNPTGWSSFGGYYPSFTAGIATFEVPELADYYSAQLSYKYVMKTIDPLDAQSFIVKWRIASGLWDTNTPGATAAWTAVSNDLSAPSDGGSHSIDLSRMPGEVAFQFVSSGGGSTDGPTIDDVAVAGFRYGPVRNLTATPQGSSAVQLSWSVPARSTAPLAADEERPIAYRVWRSPDTQPYTWTEVTDVRTTATTLTDPAPLGGSSRYLVQAWDPSDDFGWGQPVTSASVFVQPTLPTTSIFINGLLPDGSTYTALPTITLTRSTVTGTTSYRWGSTGTFVTSAAQSVPVPALNGTNTLEFYSSDALGAVESHHTQQVVVNVPDAGPAPVTSIAVSGATVRVTRDQPGGTTWYSLDNGSAVPTSSASFTLVVQPGSHTIAAYSASASGVTETPKAPLAFVVMSKPAVGTPSLSTSRPRHGRYFYLRGSLGPAHAATTTLRLYVERYSSGRYRAYRTFTVTLPAGATSYSYRVTLSLTGKYRVRAYHADTLHTATYSGYRNFIVYT